jgi:hypothetical protein
MRFYRTEAAAFDREADIRMFGLQPAATRISVPASETDAYFFRLEPGAKACSIVFGRRAPPT